MLLIDNYANANFQIFQIYISSILFIVNVCMGGGGLAMPVRVN